MMKSIARHEKLRKKCRMLFEKKNEEHEQGDWAGTRNKVTHGTHHSKLAQCSKM